MRQKLFNETFEIGDVLRYVNPKHPMRWQPLHIVVPGKRAKELAVQRGSKYKRFKPMRDGVRDSRVERFTKVGTMENEDLLLKNKAPEIYSPCEW